VPAAALRDALARSLLDHFDLRPPGIISVQ
jgi:hypothetical protein